MPTFDYIARKSNGDKITGVVEAVTEAAAVKQLDDQELFPIKLAPATDTQSASSVKRMSTRDLALFFEQLADLLKSGVPLLRSLETLSNTASNAKMGAVVKEIHNQVEEGNTLGSAMEKQSKVFNHLQIAMVRAGESGGFLEQVLLDLANYLERQDELKNKLTGSLIYPCLLVVVGVIIVGVFLIWLVPKFKPFLGRMELPLPSKVLFFTSDMVVERWPIALGMAVLGILIIIAFFQTSVGKSLWIKAQIRIPIVGNAILMVSLTRMCRILGTLLASGVPILKALEITRDAITYPPLAESIEDAIESVRDGQSFTQPLRESGLVPGQILEMISIAEESNQLENVLLKISDTVERRTNQKVDQAVRLLEPCIIIVLAMVILFVALGLLIPIFSMAGNING